MLHFVVPDSQYWVDQLWFLSHVCDWHCYGLRGRVATPSAIKACIFIFWKWVQQKIQNYKPTSFSGLQIKGTEISEPLNSIRPGYTEGFYSQQAAYASRTEGLTAWHVTGETVCIIYWYVQSDQSGIRHPNRLGLGCQENWDNTSDIIYRIVEDPSLINDYVTVRYFKDEPYPM